MTEQRRSDMEVKSYTKMTADVYDALYAKKDYETEAITLKGVISHYKKSAGNKLLDVACGTGLHLPFLIDDYDITGVDLSEQQLVAARNRLPDLTFAQGDMRNFDLAHQFDVVTCLFSSIGYVHPYSEMQEAVQNMSKHLRPGGVLIIEPWLQPGVFNPNLPPHSEVGELPQQHLKVTRTAHNSIEGNVSIMQMHHVVERPSGIEEFTEEHRLALYTTDEYKRAIEASGLIFDHDDVGLSGRGLNIGVKPL